MHFDPQAFKSAITNRLKRQYGKNISQANKHDLYDALAAAVSALAAHPVTQEAWQIAYDWADRAIAAIAPLPDSTAKAALESFAHAVVHREG